MSSLPLRKHAVSKPRGATEELPVVFNGGALKAALHKTIHEAKKSVEQIAFECGVSPSYLYRACLDGESGCRFPLDLTERLMRSTGDYRLLDYLNGVCDRATVNLPRVSRLKKTDPQLINEIAGNFSGAMASVLEYFSAPDRGKIAPTIQALRRVLSDVVSVMRAVAHFHQGDLL